MLRQPEPQWEKPRRWGFPRRLPETGGRPQCRAMCIASTRRCACLEAPHCARPAFRRTPILGRVPFRTSDAPKHFLVISNLFVTHLNLRLDMCKKSSSASSMIDDDYTYPIQGSGVCIDQRQYHHHHHHIRSTFWYIVGGVVADVTLLRPQTYVTWCLWYGEDPIKQLAPTNSVVGVQEMSNINSFDA